MAQEVNDMLNPGIFFGLLTTLSWSFCIFPFTQAARRLGSNSLNHFRLLLALCFITIISFAVDSKAFSEIFSSEYTQAWLWLGLSGIVGLTIGDYFAFEAYSVLGARLGSVLTTFAPAAALCLAWILLDESLSYIGIIGIFITIIGVNFISLGKKERDKIPTHQQSKITIGVIAGILSAFCQGAGLVLAKKGMLMEKELAITINPFHATFIRLTIATSSLYLLTIFRGKIKAVMKPLFENKDGGIKFAIAGTIFGPTLGVSLSLFTVSLIEPSIAQTIFSLVPAFALFVARILTKEKITFQSLLGVTIAMSGVIILIWRDRIQELL